MHIGRIFGIGVLALAVGSCARPPFEKRPYEVTLFTGEFPKGRTVTEGTIYIARNPSGFTEYTDIGDDNRLDKKEVRKYSGPAWPPFSEVGRPLAERVEIVEDEETRQDRDRNRQNLSMVLSGAPFGEDQLESDIDLHTDRLTRFIVRYTPDGQRLQDEFSGVKASTPQD